MTFQKSFVRRRRFGVETQDREVRILKHASLVLLVGAVTFGLSSCGGNSKGPTTPPTVSLTAGNWLLEVDSVIKTATQQGLSGIKLGGELSSSGATVVPTGIQQYPCFPLQKPTASPLVFSATVTGNDAVFTWPGNNQTFTITAGLNPNNTFVGTYAESGNGTGLCPADNGTVYGVLVPSINGNWSGTLPGQAGTSNTPTVQPTSVSATFSQATDLSTDVNNNATIGTFPLDGTVTLTNPCLTAGALSLTIDDTVSYIVGDSINVATMPAADGTIFSLTQVVLIDPTTATSMTVGTYKVSGGLCNFTGSTEAGGTQITLGKS
jgi:hypothetical protein